LFIVTQEQVIMAAPKKIPMNFRSMSRTDVPMGRNGKHRAIVDKILSDLDQLPAGSAIKVPLANLTDSKENVRAALNRATRKGGRQVATSSDDTFLYVWNQAGRT
jgi:hypothetical protein